jgi:hypothetical protein
MQYVLHIFCGISLFLAFSSSLDIGCTSIIANKISLLNTVLQDVLVRGTPPASFCLYVSHQLGIEFMAFRLWF